MHYFQDHKNKVFGYLTAVECLGSNGKPGRSFWRCLCQCGNYIEARTDQLLNGKTISCGCRRKKRLNSTGKANWAWKGHQEISGTWFLHVKKSAGIRDIPFNITIEDIWELFIAQQKRCKLSGLPIDFINNTVSVDRINSFDTYNKANIQLVHKVVNISKHMLSNEIFIALCTEIAKNYIGTEHISCDILSTLLNGADTNKAYKLK